MIIEGQTYACKRVKTISPQHNQDKLPRDFVTHYCIDELNSLRCLDHPNIVRCYGFGMKSFTYFDIYFDYIEGKTLDVAYREQAGTNEELLFFWVFQICKGFLYLEQAGIIHRDIKPKNILVNTQGLIKIIDFGISKMVDSQRP